MPPKRGRLGAPWGIRRLLATRLERKSVTHSGFRRVVAQFRPESPRETTRLPAVRGQLSRASSIERATAKNQTPNQCNSRSSGNLGFETQLWAAADKMRGHMDAAEYKHVALGLIFLKCISGAFQE